MSVPDGYTLVSGTKLVDATGAPLNNKHIGFQPVDETGKPTSFQPLDGGTTPSDRVMVPVQNGIFSIQLADTATTTPPIGYMVTLIDDVTQMDTLCGGYNYIDPTGDTWSLDIYRPKINTPITMPRPFVASGRKHAGGLVPDPGPVTGTARYLREDGTWVTPPLPARSINGFGSDLVYTPYVVNGSLVGLATIADDFDGDLYDLFIGVDGRVSSAPSSGSAGSPGLVFLGEGDNQVYRLFISDGDLDSKAILGSSGLDQIVLIRPDNGSTYRAYFLNSELTTTQLT